MTTSSPPAGQSVTGLVHPALASLERSLLPSGLVCYEVVEGEAAPRGESVRYTLIVLLGILRAERAGIFGPLASGDLRDAADVALGRLEVTPGDIALRLWAEARADTGSTGDLVGQLERSLVSNGGLAAREGLELGWIVTALALSVERDDRASGMLAEALTQLLDLNQAPSGLFRHFGHSGFRRRFPNFATEIYSVLALAIVGGLGLDDRALPAARRAADRLLELQLPDGGWPWLYDAERGTVVERYEVYAVHQHGMAPMALNELARATGDDRYSAAALRGVPWMFGANELGVEMAPFAEHDMTYRSIRRRAPLDRAWLYANTAASTGGMRPLGRSGRQLEINRTCRPYELGWLIEAWAEALAAQS